MHGVVYCLLGCYLIATCLGTDDGGQSMDKLGFSKDYNEIVRDLIKNWESPIVYLRQLGYLSNDYKDTSKIKPSLDALMNRIQQGEERSNKLHLMKMLKKKKKRENVEAKKNDEKTDNLERQQRQPLKYLTVDEMMAMAQNPKLRLQMTTEDLTAENPNLNLMLLDQMQQPQGQVQWQAPEQGQRDSSGGMLLRLVANTRPVEPTLMQAAELKLASGTPLDVGTPIGGTIDVGNVLDKSNVLAQAPSIGPPTMMFGNNINNAVNSIMSSHGTSGLSGLGETNAMSTYGTIDKNPVIQSIFQSSRPDGVQSQSKLNSAKTEIEAPQYLNWDMKNNRFRQIPSIVKDAYVDKLVQLFVKKQNPQFIFKYCGIPVK